MACVATTITTAPTAPNRQKEVRSIGIACCRVKDGAIQALVVNKRYTYAFLDFVEGRYKSTDDNAIIILLNKTTAEEKTIIMTKKFIMLWYRVWLDSSQRSSRYVVAKSKFETTFLADGGVRLMRLIERAESIWPIWEIPKGKKRNRAEVDICCAIREFQEETGIEKRQYTLFLERPLRHSFVDAGVRYTYIYYIAIIKNNDFIPRIDFRLPEQLDEIVDIRWACPAIAAALDGTGRLSRLITDIAGIIAARRRVRS